MENARILIVEDDVEFARGIRNILELEGYEVSCATTGKRGLEWAINNIPDLVILDVMMEHSTAGFETCRELRKINKLGNVPIIMVTGISNELHLPFSVEPDESYLPVTRIIHKPVQPQVLLRGIKAALADSKNKRTTTMKDAVTKNKILVIDDDSNFRTSMKFLLTETGYEVITANKGASGFTEAVAERPDLIMLDVMMEDCSAGLDTVRRLRDDTDTAEIPVILVTGIRTPQYLLESYAKDESFPNVRGTFQKPVAPEQLLAVIKMQIQEKAIAAKGTIFFHRSGEVNYE